MKKKIMAVLLALAMVTQGAMPVFAQNEGAEGIETAADAETAKILCKEYLSEEQQIQGIDQRFEIPQEDVSFVNDLGSGTITLSFKTGSTNLQALAAINGDKHANHYMSLYISGGNKIGFEFRKNATVNDHRNFTVDNVNLADNQWHTITLAVEKDSYYKVYLDQKLVQKWEVDETNFVDKMEWEPTSVTFGGAKRFTDYYRCRTAMRIKSTERFILSRRTIGSDMKCREKGINILRSKTENLSIMSSGIR